MFNKLGPELQEMAELAASSGESSERVEVMIGLTQSTNAEIRYALEACGFEVRSELGDILTGTVRLVDLYPLAKAPEVAKIDASRPMFTEAEYE